MANRIQGINIAIGADVQPLNKALESVNKNSKNIQSELKQVERLLKLDPTNTTLLAQKQDLLSKAIDNTSDKLETLKEAEKQVQKQFENGEVGEDQYRALQREVIKTEQELKKFKTQVSDSENKTDKFSKGIYDAKGNLIYFEDAVSDVGKEVNDLGDETDKASKKALDFGDVLSANMISDVAIGLLEDFASAMVDLSKQLDSASGKIQASLGLTTEQAEELKEVAQNVWTDGFGEDITDVTNNLAIVRQYLGNISDFELQEILEKAYIINDVFGAEIPESIRAVKTLMQNFGITADEAFDLITVGYQKGLNFSDEFIDVINEYSVQFKDMGLSAEDAFYLLKQGVDNGALSLDKVADSMKEFNIRIKDGSDTTNEGLQLLGINADEVTQKLADGSMTSSEAMQLVIDKLKDTDDKVLQNKIGVDLFGTQWEDTGSTVILSLDNIEGGLGDVTDATKKAGDTVQDNVDTKMTLSFRHLQDALNPVSDGFMDWASELVDDVAQAIDYVRDGIDFLSTSLDNAQENVKDLDDTVSKSFNKIKTTIEDSIDKAEKAVKDGIRNMKSFFDFKWDLPKIKLPHFSTKGKFSLNPPQVPDFNVNWYKNGGVFSSASIIGVAENGREAVMPLDRNTGWIDELASKLNSNNNSGNSITIQSMNVRNDKDIKSVAQELYKLQQQNSRGRGLR